MVRLATLRKWAFDSLLMTRFCVMLVRFISLPLDRQRQNQGKYGCYNELHL
jgi:hypothetical protein